MTIALCVRNKWLTDEKRSQLLGFFLTWFHFVNGSEQQRVSSHWFCQHSGCPLLGILFPAGNEDMFKNKVLYPPVWA